MRSISGTINGDMMTEAQKQIIIEVLKALKGIVRMLQALLK